MVSKTLTFDIFGRDKTASKTMKGVGKSADGLGKTLGKLGGIIGVTFGAKEIFDFGKDSVAAFLDAEKQQNKLDDAYARFPALADVTRKSFDLLNTSIEHKTGFDDDALASGEAILAQFKLTGKQIQDLIPLTADYARKTGKDIPTASTLLGKAMLGNAKALKDLGINFHATGDTAADYTTIMGLLRDKVGGFAEKEGTTAAGKLEILKARFDDVKEEIGAALMPVLSDLADFAQKNLLPALEDTAHWIHDTGVPALKDFATWIGENKDILGPAAIAVGGLTAAQWLLNAAMTANPVGAVIMGIETLIALGVLVATNWDTVRTVFGTVQKTIGDGMFDIGISVASFFETMAQNAVDSLLKPVNLVRQLFGLKALTVDVDFTSAIKAVKGNYDHFAQTMIDGQVPGTATRNSTVNSSSAEAKKKVVAHGGGRADGGLIRATPGGILQVLGEGRYDEVVTPLSPGVLAALGGGSKQTVFEFHGEAGALAQLFTIFERKADGSRVLVSKMGKQ